MTQRFMLVLAGIVLAVPASASQLRAYAGVVAGNASGAGGPFACATSGPTIGNGWFAGLALPPEGFAGCNLAGGIDDQQGSAGPLNASQSASGPMMGGVGTYTGSAQARAADWSLGVAVNGTATGGTSAFTYHQSAAFASFIDTVTLQAPGIATGTSGAVNFAFLVDGIMGQASVAPYTQQSDIGLGIRVNGTFIWDSFRGTNLGQSLPYVRGGSTGLPGGFVLGPGTLDGSALVTSTANFGIQWGVPFTVEVALIANTHPCCQGASSSVDFLNTALPKGVDAYGPGGKIDQFTVATASGARIGPGGLLPVPEPGSWLLALAGLGVLAITTR